MSADRASVLLAALFSLVGVPLVVSAGVLLVDVGLSSRRPPTAAAGGAVIPNGAGRVTGPRSGGARAGRAPVTRRADRPRRPGTRRGPS